MPRIGPGCTAIIHDGTKKFYVGIAKAVEVEQNFSLDLPVVFSTHQSMIINL